MSDRPLVVLKFGSSVLRGEEDLPCVAAEIDRHVGKGCRVVAVVSAIGRHTEELIQRAISLGHTFDASFPVAGEDVDASDSAPVSDAAGAPAETAFAALLATGEATSAALVGLALDRVGVPFSILCAGRVGPFTRGPQLDAQPCAFDVSSVTRALGRRPVAILPGFVGRDAEGGFSLLGRGGSDLTALFVAHSLSADRCRLLKDVDGVYERDPAIRTTARPRRYASLDWNDALRMDDAILQRKATQFAYRHRVEFEVGRCGSEAGTLVGAAGTRLTPDGGKRSRASRAKSPSGTSCHAVAEGGLAS